MRHATDPDHVIAISTIVARQRSTRHAAVIGVVWGIGHTLTILIVGGAIILLGWVIPARVGLSMELSVGVMLMVLGIMNLTGVLGRIVDPLAHSHAHSHGDYVHTHVHGHDPESHPHQPEQTPVGWLDRHCAGLGPYQMLRPLIVGIVHGLAGSAAVALLVLTTIREPLWGIAYLLVFGLGTIAGMMLITTLVAAPIVYSQKQYASAGRRLQLATGLISLALGLFVAYQIGIIDHLFGAAPIWAPR